MENNEALIEEMLSKVDVRKVKRIISSSLQINATKLRGIVKLLREWAEAKVEVYKLFDNNLKITVEREVEIDREEFYRMSQEIMHKFPRRMVLNA